MRFTEVAELRGPSDEHAMATLKKLAPNRGIIVKSRTGIVTLGEGLPADELRYLVPLLRKAVSA
jgi:hypothetical protein